LLLAYGVHRGADTSGCSDPLPGESTGASEQLAVVTLGKSYHKSYGRIKERFNIW
jgi:hypothetical protein